MEMPGPSTSTLFLGKTVKDAGRRNLSGFYLISNGEAATWALSFLTAAWPQGTGASLPAGRSG